MIMGLGGLGGPSAYAMTMGQFDPVARAEYDAWTKCGYWNAPWYCTGLIGSTFIQSCREHDSLVEACVKGQYKEPPMPPAPRPPAGADSGAATNPDSVDEVVDENAEAYRRQALEFYREAANNLPPADPNPGGLEPWVLPVMLGGGLLLVILLKR